MKKLFTLIELIVTIVVIGILAAIVIPNISSFKEEAKETAIISDGRNLQTAVDMYQLDNHGAFPVTDKIGDSTNPTFGHPKIMDFNALYPIYLRDVPQFKGMYYWVDYQGKVYYSTIDNPNDFTEGDAGLTWTANEDASAYNLYEVESSSSGSSKRVILKSVGKLKGNVSSYNPVGYSKEKTYLINVVDEYGYESPPVGSGYKGIIPFQQENSNQGTLPSTPEKEDFIENPKNKLVSAGQYHTLVVDENADLWSFGTNRYGQLGYSENIGTIRANSVPRKIMSGVRSVAAGNEHTLVLKENGELLSFGSNKYGQLGYAENSGTTNPNPHAKMVMSGVKSIAANSYFSLVIKEDGTLLSFGHNQYGQLGHSDNNGTINPNFEPKEVLTNVKSATAGFQHSLVIKENGELWSFGFNYYGQLGYTENNLTSNPNPVAKFVTNEVKSVAAGYYYTLIVKENGKLISFGENLYGQLGYSENLGTNHPNPSLKEIMDGVKSVSAGYYHSLVLTNDGKLWSFGHNYYGELGYRENIETGTPNPSAREVMSGVSSFVAGANHSIAAKENGELWSFGRNLYGQMGLSKNIGNSNPNYQPEQFQLNE